MPLELGGLTMVYVAAGLLGLLGGLIAYGLLAVFRKVNGGEDERSEMLESMLPGVNCGACGTAGCADMARALAAGEREPSGCPIASPNTIKAIAELLGVEEGERKRKVAQLVCRGKVSAAPARADYIGLRDCVAANAVAGGQKGCTFGCLGFGTCVGVCPVGAIKMGDDGLPHIDVALCTGCGLCVQACPRNTLELIEEGQGAVIRCISQASGKTVRGVCEVGCIQCKICIRECPQKAISIKDGRVWIDPALCDGCGICAEKCPNGVIDVHLKEIFERVSA